MRHLAPICALLLLAASASAATPEQLRFFEAKVRPLLIKHCQECHGSKKQSGGLRLDTAAGFRTGGDNGALIDPKNHANSLLMKAVRHEGPKMPPKKMLASSDIDILAEWAKMGA